MDGNLREDESTDSQDPEGYHPSGRQSPPSEARVKATPIHTWL